MEWNETLKSVEEWLEATENDGYIISKRSIPCRELLNNFLSDINKKSEEDILRVLRNLLGTHTKMMDLADIRTYEFFLKKYTECNKKTINAKEYKEFLDGFLRCEKNLRMLSGNAAWEGLTWVLELLPWKPYKAIRVLQQYLEAEMMSIHDERIIGINQAIEIIEARYININKGLEKYIFNLTAREFEILIASLYKHIGYKVELTPVTRDGGKDIVAKINREDGEETVYIECKLYKTTQLSKGMVRGFVGSIMLDKVNRGVLFCTGYVNEELKNFDPRIQIWTLEEIIVLLNAHLGSEWYKRLSNLLKK